MKLNKNNIEEFMGVLTKGKDYKLLNEEFSYFLGLEDETSDWVDAIIYWTLERVVNAR